MSAPDPAASRPNILFILADDLGWGDVGYHGSPIRTPNIDRLVSEGVELDRHYVCPMCTPTRVCLLTGRHPGRFGAHATVPSNAPVLPDGYPTLPAVLRDAGYDTGLFGKWHLGSSPRHGPNRYGFDTAYGSLAGGVDPYNHRYKRGPFSVTWHRDGALVEEPGHVTDLIAREAVSWVEGRTRPWFCYVPFTAVHVPVKAPQPWLDAYASSTYDEDPARDRSFKLYAAYTSHMDWAVGQLVEALERTGQRDNTLIVFTSDNGAIEGCPIHGTDRYPGWQEASPRLGSNQPLRGVKAQLYEGGIRTPTVAAWRGVLTPSACTAPMHMVDWMPTLCRLAGVASPRTQPEDGIDMWPALSGRETAPERRFYWNFAGARALGARIGDWKLILGEGKEGDRTVELFNVAEDPYEQRECAADHPDRVRLLTGYVEEQRRLDDAGKRDDVDDPLVDG